MCGWSVKSYSRLISNWVLVVARIETGALTTMNSLITVCLIFRNETPLSRGKFYFLNDRLGISSERFFFVRNNS